MRGRTLAGAAMAVVVIAAAACGRTSAPPVATDAVADSADQIMFDVRMNLTDEGVLRGKLFADTAFVFDQSSRLAFRRVRAEFMKATGVQDGTMTADRGTYNLRDQVLEGYGNVRIVTVDGRRLSSPHLRYDEAANLVTSDSAFTMVQGEQTQTGVGFEADPQLTRFRCKASCGGTAPISIPIE